MLTFLDTHVALWLYFGKRQELSESALEIIDHSSELSLSPVALLECTFLREIGRISVATEKIAAVLNQELQIPADDVPLATLIHFAHDLSWTRDPFDRLLIAHCLVRRAQLLTRDRIIRQNFPQAVW